MKQFFQKIMLINKRCIKQTGYLDLHHEVSQMFLEGWNVLIKIKKPLDSQLNLCTIENIKSQLEKDHQIHSGILPCCGCSSPIITIRNKRRVVLIANS